MLVGFGGWFLGMRALVSNVVTEDYVTYAELAGVEQGRIVGAYVIRNALVPQLTALAMALGGVFSGTVITEQVFNYPGLGSLLIDAVNAGDYSLVLAVSTVSITAVAVAIFIVDLLHPFSIHACGWSSHVCRLPRPHSLQYRIRHRAGPGDHHRASSRC